MTYRPTFLPNIRWRQLRLKIDVNKSWQIWSLLFNDPCLKYLDLCGTEQLLRYECLKKRCVLMFCLSTYQVHMKTGKRKTLGRIMLKGDNITLLQGLEHTESMWKPEPSQGQFKYEWMLCVGLWPKNLTQLLQGSVNFEHFDFILQRSIVNI